MACIESYLLEGRFRFGFQNRRETLTRNSRTSNYITISFVVYISFLLLFSEEPELLSFPTGFLALDIFFVLSTVIYSDQGGEQHYFESNRELHKILR